ncbi:MAG TPA: sigma-E factor regulatory protein RseB domain-containing protein, partial [Desulfobacteria bacterium]|nr:sigma-E factor regulatory protein RseB domain-containing protein [Desulfobacteria bacterium]
MRRTSEEELDILIDSLNNEQEPRQKLDSETLQLLAVARAVKSIRPQAEPTKSLGQRIYRSINNSTRRFRIILPTAALAAGLLVFLFFTTLWTGAGDVVHAMNKAAANLANYHGLLEVRVKNEAGKDWLVRKAELWSEGDKYAIHQDGTLTVNNNQRKWQIRPQTREVALLPPVPDPVRQGFDLKDEAKQANQYPHTVIGEELIAGHSTTKLKISPPGGQPYYLWVDKETNLPLQLQTAV